MPRRHARAAAAVEAVGEQVRRQRRQHVLARAVLVHITRDAECRQVADLGGIGDGAAEHDDRQAALVDLPHVPHELGTGRVRQPEVEQDQVDPLEIRPDACQQFGGGPHRDRPVARFLERRLEAVAHERGVVGDEHGLCRARSGTHRVLYRRAPSASVRPRCAALDLVAIIQGLLRNFVHDCVHIDLPTDCSGRSAAALPEDCSWRPVLSVMPTST